MHWFSYNNTVVFQSMQNLSTTSTLPLRRVTLELLVPEYHTVVKIWSAIQMKHRICLLTPHFSWKTFFHARVTANWYSCSFWINLNLHTIAIFLYSFFRYLYCMSNSLSINSIFFKSYWSTNALDILSVHKTEWSKICIFFILVLFMKLKSTVYKI